LLSDSFFINQFRKSIEMNSAVFPWKMLAVMAAAIIVVFVGGFFISGKQPAYAQQPVYRYKSAVTTPVTGPDSTAIKAAKKNQLSSVTKPVKRKFNIRAVIDTVSVTKKPAEQADDTPLDESIVMSMSPGMNSDKSKDTKEAHPKTGWDSFEKYLSTDATSPNGKPGSVRIAFIVNNDGSLTNFKIKNGINAATDKKAIELIKNGPSWVGNINKEANEVNVTINFH